MNHENNIDEGGINVRVAGQPFELRVRTFRDWLAKYTVDGDILKVIKLSEDGDCAIRNERTAICYFETTRAREPS